MDKFAQRVSRKRQILYLSISLIAVGCSINRESYPPDWSPVLRISNGDCSSIDGSYNDRFLTKPDKNFKNGLEVSLTSVLVDVARRSGVSRSDLPDLVVTASVVSLKYSESSIAVQVGYTDRISANFPISNRKGFFRCIDGSVQMSWTRADVASPIPGASVSTVRLLLTKSADGSLVAERRAKEAGAFLVIPVGSISNGWSRFAPAPNNRIERAHEG